MQKIINIVCGLNLITVMATSVSACSENYLTITMQDQADEDILDNIAFDFMYKLPDVQQPHLDRDKFGHWLWRTSTDITLRGTVMGYVKNPLDPQHTMEYWTIDLRKTAARGLFVWHWQENPNNPW